MHHRKCDPVVVLSLDISMLGGSRCVRSPSRVFGTQHRSNLICRSTDYTEKT